MANFCINCGKKLDEAGVCSCQAANNNPEERKFQDDQMAYEKVGHDVSYVNEVDYSLQANRAKEILATGWNRILGIIISLVRYPFTKGILFTNSDDDVSASIIISIHALATALVTTLAMSRINKLMELFSDYVDYGTMSMLKMPLGKIFFTTFIVSALLSVIYALFLLVFSVLMKNNISFKAALCTTAARSSVIIIIIPVSILLFLVSPYMGIFVFGLGNYAGIAYMTQVFPVTTQERRNHVPLIVFLATALFLLASSYLMIKAIPMFLPEALSDLVPYYEELMSDPSSIFESIVGGVY